MKSTKLFLLLAIAYSNLLLAQQAPTTEWMKCYGGSAAEYGRYICAVPTGGYIVAGFTNSQNGDITSYKGTDDFWVIRVNADGTIRWQKNYGGTGPEYSYTILNTSDGGFIFSGNNGSNNGDMSGLKGSTDVGIIKIDSNGNLLWSKSLGGTNSDQGFSMAPTSDGGYVICAMTLSHDLDVGGNYGMSDVWVAKLDATGTIQWSRNYGGSASEQPWCIRQTADGGYIFTGITFSNALAFSQIDSNVTGNHGQGDAWVVKLTSAGVISWQRAYGGSNIDIGEWIEQTVDGGYILTATTKSTDGDVTATTHGNNDIWVLKLDATGNITWQKAYGGSADDQGAKVMPMLTGGYILAGTVQSADGDISGNHGSADLWLARLDTVGGIIWKKCYGGVQSEGPTYMAVTPDFGYAITGFTNSNDGDVSGNHGGGNDVWVIKTGTDSTVVVSVPVILRPDIRIWPVPTDGSVTVQLPHGYDGAAITVTDILGKTIIVDKQYGTLRHIDLNNFPNGNYILQVLNNGNRSVYRLNKM